MFSYLLNRSPCETHSEKRHVSTRWKKWIWKNLIPWKPCLWGIGLRATHWWQILYARIDTCLCLCHNLQYQMIVNHLWVATYLGKVTLVKVRDFVSIIQLSVYSSHVRLFLQSHLIRLWRGLHSAITAVLKFIPALTKSMKKIVALLFFTLITEGAWTIHHKSSSFICFSKCVTMLLRVDRSDMEKLWRNYMIWWLLHPKNLSTVLYMEAHHVETNLYATIA